MEMKMEEETKTKHEKEFRYIFACAGFIVSNVWEMPEHNPNAVSSPWFFIKFFVGNVEETFIIGWCEKTIHIDWYKSKKRFLYLFNNEPTLKSEECVHASDIEKAIEYLTRIRKEIEPQKQIFTWKEVYDANAKP